MGGWAGIENPWPGLVRRGMRGKRKRQSGVNMCFRWGEDIRKGKYWSVCVVGIASGMV